MALGDVPRFPVRWAFKRRRTAPSSSPAGEAQGSANHKNAGKKQGHRRSTEPDWAILRREMKREHVTLSILWDEVHQGLTRMDIATAASASFTGLGRQDLCHDAANRIWRGDKLFVDYAGDTVAVVLDLANRRDQEGADFCRHPGRH